MNRSFLKVIGLILFLVIISCKDEINNPIDQTDKLYKVEGWITFNNDPILNLEIVLDTSKCFTDSSGYFLFDSLKSGSSEIKINHPQFIPIDTILNINADLTISFELQYRSNSFLPLNIGNKWLYHNLMAQRPDSTEHELVIEVMTIEQKSEKNFYKLLFTDTSNDLIDTSRYYRYFLIENDTLYENRCDEMELLAPFNVPLGHNFEINLCSMTYNSILYDKAENYEKFFYQAVMVFDADFSFIFEKGKGIIQYWTSWSNFLLDKYEIHY
jgi:hypothetical protein